jgi:hypothetical protein
MAASVCCSVLAAHPDAFAINAPQTDRFHGIATGLRRCEDVLNNGVKERARHIGCSVLHGS